LTRAAPARVNTRVAFDVAGASYDRFMGRHSSRLAPVFADFAEIRAAARVLDVGCGSGSLTAELARRVGASSVAAADPSESLAAACAARLAEADVRQAPAEDLPWPDGTFDAALAQLVLIFMTSAERGAAELRRVLRERGTAAACVWDYSAPGPLGLFWDAARALDPVAPDEARTMRFQDRDELRRLWEGAGFGDVEPAALELQLEFASFDDFWEPYLLGVGPAGAYCTSLDDGRREALREECRSRLRDPRGAFTLPARALAVRGAAS
jgi:ubiquinone/menaquinone biosynthesis C-methylase UbiE